jgi:hypothetical protein
MIGMSSDHAGINQELGRLRAELYHALAQLEDARDVRRYIDYMRIKSREMLDGYPFVRSEK